MVLGYDEKRPTKNQYEDFLGKLVDGLSDSWFDGLSLGVFGSFLRQDYVPGNHEKGFVVGRSDIDALLIFPHDVVINKEIFLEAARIYDVAQRKNNIPFQVTVTDVSTMEEGTFNSFSPDFDDYFNREFKVVLGPDYRREFRYELPRFPTQGRVSFNLKKCRQGLFFSEWYKSKYPLKFREIFEKSLSAISGVPKHILLMIDGKLREEKFSSLEILSETFPDLDLTPFQKLKRLSFHSDELDNLYQNANEITEVWADSVDFFERLVKCYLDRKDKI